MHHRITLIFVGIALVFAATLAGGPPSAAAARVETGFVDFGYSGLSAPTGEKPQSKLWYNDGRWWADMLYLDGKHYIFYLDSASQNWVRTATQLDSRTLTKSDCLWDGAHLYVASGGGLESTNADLDGVLYRYSYSAASKSYTRDFGPITIRAGGAETIVIDKDSTGRLWTTYAQKGQIYISHSLGSDTQWATAFPVPAAGVNVNIAADDISSLAAFSGKIAVLWSNQLDGTFYFAIHQDGAAPSAWTGGIALRAPNIADDHINIKAVQGDSSGRLFAVVKTSVAGALTSTPRILLLVRGPDGRWGNTVVSTGADHQTRPILLVDSGQRRLYVFTADDAGGAIYLKQAWMDNPYFLPGKGTPVIRSSLYTAIDNATATKQNVSRATGIVVLASDDPHARYLHSSISYGAAGAAPPYRAYMPVARR